MSRYFKSTTLIVLVVLGASLAPLPGSRSAAAADFVVRGDVSKGILEDCLPVTFVGAHGVEEGAAGGVAGLDHWGNTIQAVWVDFAAQVPSPGALAADYPFI